MAQQSNEHLTIAELSAYLDEELAPEELALCDAHIQICQPCQAALTDLRLTSALLGSMPQVAVPRSFVLPTNLVLLPETPNVASINTSTRPASKAPAIWRSSVRAVSTLVAILGLLFFLAGALTALPHGGGSAASTTSSTGRAYVPSTQSEPAPTPTGFVTSTPAQHISPDTRATHQATSTGADHLTPTPISTRSAYSGQNQNHDQSQNQPQTPQPELPAALDLGQPAGRLTIGISLLLLGILGVIITRLLDRLARHS
ncbi:MAG TPA: zf-HC2 domain-containing protein [Ktedonobacteraceae bacterium]|nr:zf-HC2 domain-containing protein [Ktedonobacteraceae bacterium]